MDYEIMQLECLKIAASQGFKGRELISEADRMYNHIRGRGAPVVQNDKVRVVGRDGDIDPKHPFSDYVRDDK
jgi:hypothetical protein